MKAETVMRRMHVFRLTLASVAMLILLNATPAYSQSIQVLAIAPTTPTTLYAGTNGGGVFKSTNLGASWSAVNTGLTSPGVLALAVDPATPTILYAGTGGAGGAFVFMSTDGGGSWSPVLAG